VTRTVASLSPWMTILGAAVGVLFLLPASSADAQTTNLDFDLQPLTGGAGFGGDPQTICPSSLPVNITCVVGTPLPHARISGPTTDMTAFMDSFTLPTPTSSHGLRLAGWYFAPGGQAGITSTGQHTVVGTGGETVNLNSFTWPSGTQTLRARWEGTITYDPNGGTVDTSLAEPNFPNTPLQAGFSTTPTSVTALAGFGVVHPIPYRPGWAFNGWTSSRPSPSIAPVMSRTSGSVLVNHTGTFTAQWTQFTTAPVLQSAALSANRTQVTLTFSSPVGFASPLSAFSYTGANFDSNFDFNCNEFRVVAMPRQPAFEGLAYAGNLTAGNPPYGDVPSRCRFASDPAASSPDTIVLTASEPLAASATALTVEYRGRSLAQHGQAAQFVHQSEIAVSGVAAASAIQGSANRLTLACEPSVLRVATDVRCQVDGGDNGIEILWRAARNPVFAGAGVTLDSSGRGAFGFRVPAAALGQEVTVELVEWLPPQSLGIVGGPIPASIPAGSGLTFPAGLVLLGLIVAAGSGVAVRRMSQAA